MLRSPHDSSDIVSKDGRRRGWGRFSKVGERRRACGAGTPRAGRKGGPVEDGGSEGASVGWSGQSENAPPDMAYLGLQQMGGQ